MSEIYGGDGGSFSAYWNEGTIIQIVTRGGSDHRNDGLKVGEIIVLEKWGINFGIKKYGYTLASSFTYKIIESKVLSVLYGNSDELSKDGV